MFQGKSEVPVILQTPSSRLCLSLDWMPGVQDDRDFGLSLKNICCYINGPHKQYIYIYIYIYISKYIKVDIIFNYVFHFWEFTILFRTFREIHLSGAGFPAPEMYVLGTYLKTSSWKSTKHYVVKSDVYWDILLVGSTYVTNYILFQGTSKSPSSCKTRHPGPGTSMH